MHFAFTDDQEMFRDTVRDLLADKCGPEAVRAAWEGDTGRVPGLWDALVEMGVVGLTTPEVHGGLGMDEADLVLLLEETGRAAAPEPLLEHVAVGVPALGDAGGAVAEQWLPAAASGEALVSVGLTVSPYVPYADQADVLVLQSGDELHAVAVDAVSLTAQPSIDGSRRLFAVDWSPSPDTRIGGADAVARALDRAAVAAAAQCVGVARRLVSTTVEYVSERYQFGKPVGTYQAVKHHLANAAMGFEFAGPVTYYAAWCVANGTEEASREASMAKALASDAVDTACRIALQCHGAIGYTYEYDLQLWLKRGWTLAAAWGDARHHRDRVGAALGV